MISRKVLQTKESRFHLTPGEGDWVVEGEGEGFGGREGLKGGNRRSVCPQLPVKIRNFSKLDNDRR